jgi:hypothetical protein
MKGGVKFNGHKVQEKESVMLNSQKAILGIAVVILVLSGFLPVCRAEPSTTIKYFMNEPVTMFDWGMYRLEEDLQRWASGRKDLEPHVSVVYDWDSNRLDVIFLCIQKSSTPSESSTFKKSLAKYQCEGMTQNIREYLNMPLGIERYFRHEGFSNKGSPKKLREDIENITFVRVEICSDKDYLKLRTAESPLMGKEIFFTDTN